MGDDSRTTDAALRVFDALKDAARGMRLVTYNELAAAGAVAPQGVGRQLNVITAGCAAALPSSRGWSR